MSSNNTNITNTTAAVQSHNEMPIVIHFFKYSEIVLAVVGTLLNLWLLVAILSSQEMRSRLRNKIICNILVVHLLDCAIIIPACVTAVMTGWSLGCVFTSVFTNLQLMQEFIVNWLLVMLLVVFIAQIQDFNPRMRLTPKAVTLGTLGLLVLPWVASLVVVPIIVHQYSVGRYIARSDCFYPTYDAYQIFKSVDTVVPIILAVLLVIVAAALRYRRFTHGYSSGSMRTELISRGPEIDNPFAYITAVVVATICDLLQLVLILCWQTISKYGFLEVVNLAFSSFIMSDSRVVLMPLPWLLLPDFRQRIQTWRPWYRPGPGIDLTVTYSKEEY